MIAAILASPLSRIVPIGMILLALQKTLFLEITPFGVYIQVVMAFAASAGAAGGPERGAVTGFTLGIMFDLAIGTPLGSSAITMGIAGSLAGWIDVIRVETTWWLAAIFVALGTGVGELAVPIVRRFIGENEPFVDDLALIVLVVAIAGGILSIVLVPTARWALKLERPAWKVPAEG